MKIYTSYKELPDTISLKLKEANVFFSMEYNNYISAIGKKIIYFATDDYIIPYEVRQKSIFSFGRYLSEPFCLNQCVNSVQKRKEFINYTQNYISNQKISDWQDSVGAYTMFDVYPDFSKRICFGNFVINLENEVDILLGNMTSKHRNMVRRAEKDGVTIKIGGLELLDDYCDLDAQTWKRSGQTPVNRSVYDNMLRYMPTSSFIAISYYNDVPQTGMLSYYNNQMMYYMYGASKDSPTVGANNYLHWVIMKEMKARGVKKYSLVGFRLQVDPDGKLAGIQHFKKGFGGELVEGYLFKATFSKPKRRLFEFLYKLKNKVNFEEDAIDQEISKWEGINS
ncbi:MAG: peptidoglycan bridge formation glycyltransferase FemA/FemB family protein [Candidatus Cloacimonetes bacterium]|nr:peptidoglycan bridge formation glycyltransferase FemA/FemB family protein [Candidatus Cloacimonadota bacterium]MDY0230641.1 peptidoglycan bridge formation glycyltransferase FemA/FemB family protein [Candidatus Cloacimonadaceae bacterium]